MQHLPGWICSLEMQSTSSLKFAIDKLRTVLLGNEAVVFCRTASCHRLTIWRWGNQILHLRCARFSLTGLLRWPKNIVFSKKLYTCVCAWLMLFFRGLLFKGTNCSLWVFLVCSLLRSLRRFTPLRYILSPYICVAFHPTSQGLDLKEARRLKSQPFQFSTVCLHAIYNVCIFRLALLSRLKLCLW